MDWLQGQQERTEEAIEKLRTSADTAEGTKGVTIHAAIVGARSNQELSAASMAAAQTIAEHVSALTLTLSKSSGELASKIDTFTTATADSSNEMSRWTFWMMVSSIVLAVLTVIQVYLAVQQSRSPVTPTVIVVPTPSKDSR